MGVALREAWLWLLLAFMLGLAIGYVVRQRPTRAHATADGATTGGVGTTRIAALEVSAPATVAVPAEKAATKVHATATPATPTPAKPASTASASATPAPAIAPTATTPATTEARRKTPSIKTPSAKTLSAKTPSSKAPSSKAPSRRSAAKAVVLDLAAAKATLGVTVKLDDLKLIEGIGPRIETLFKADGITSWRELSKANVERLQGVLDAAGPRYKIHNPASWPRQAGLLADGKWAEFKTMTDKLKGGR